MQHEAEELLAAQVAQLAIDEPKREYRFHPTRRWRFDFAWPAAMVAMEIDGGGFVGGRHSTGMGMERDAEKVNAAAALGWRVLRATPRMVRDGRALRAIVEAM